MLNLITDQYYYLVIASGHLVEESRLQRQKSCGSLFFYEYTCVLRVSSH